MWEQWMGKYNIYCLEVLIVNSLKCSTFYSNIHVHDSATDRNGDDLYVAMGVWIIWERGCLSTYNSYYELVPAHFRFNGVYLSLCCTIWKLDEIKHIIYDQIKYIK